LVASVSGAAFSACGPGYRGCVVRGIDPAAIDSVQPVLLSTEGRELADTPYAFRCAWSNKE
jgi:hypothetical protein